MEDLLQVHNSGAARIIFGPSTEANQSDKPLVVDLDGSLIHTDLLIEAGISYLGKNPLGLFTLIGSWMRGKAALKAALARRATIEAETLPYNKSVIDLVRKAQRAGRKVYIASASNESYVRAVAEYIRADGWFASDENVNLTAAAKAQRLVQQFGEKGFDYVGDNRADLPVWSVCRNGYAVCPSRSLQNELRGIASVEVIAETKRSAKTWLKLMRVHQWAKNALVFVPVLTSHQFGILSALTAAEAFVAFCLAASAVYILNDLVDLNADRKHPTKKSRPLASGRVSIGAALPLAFLLMTTAVVIAIAVNSLFALVLALYAALTTGYTFVLKRKMLVDVVVLAGLYTIRVIAGAAAISVPISEWLLAFSMFIFTSLALIKRYVEIASRSDLSLPDPTDRNYRISDLDIVTVLAAASGFNAITVFALYVSSDAVKSLYTHPQLLWLICPILMYWIARALMMAHRRMMDDDPVIFALRDRNSLLAAILIVGIVLAAAAPF